jgi:outer membrane protein OmpA-like peptidoglycan-associated protein
MNNLKFIVNHNVIAAFFAVYLLGGCASQPEITYDSSTTAELQDEDSDGVIKARDLCADTVIGAKVDNDGCAEKIENVLTVNLKLLFDNDSSIIKKAYYPELENFAKNINESKGLVIELEGHASKVGDDKYNLTLSNKRANKVKSLLVDKYNVDANSLSVVAFGASKLVMQGDQESQHSLNRRVVAYIQVSNEADLLRWNIYTTDNKSD